MRMPPRTPLAAPLVKPWTRTKVETVGRYRVFDVQKADMLTPNGQPAPHPIYTFQCPSWCNVVAVTPDDTVVFVWQYRHGTDRLSLEIPGGVIDAGESPIEAARRELLEETGYAVDALEPLSQAYANPALQPNTQYSFLGRNARKVGDTHFDATEECELALVPVDDLAALIDEGVIDHALCVIAVERFLRRERR